MSSIAARAASGVACLHARLLSETCCARLTACVAAAEGCTPAPARATLWHAVVRCGCAFARHLLSDVASSSTPYSAAMRNTRSRTRICNSARSVCAERHDRPGERTARAAQLYAMESRGECGVRAAPSQQRLSTIRRQASAGIQEQRAHTRQRMSRCSCAPRDAHNRLCLPEEEGMPMLCGLCKHLDRAIFPCSGSPARHSSQRRCCGSHRR
jgi:hypothetical protein